jgi:hypothetical protein
MENNPETEAVKDISNSVRIMLNGDRIGYCPWCKAAVSMRSFPVSRCMVCWHLINWDINGLRNEQ